MSDSRASEILARHERMEGERSQWLAHWQEIAERVLPRQDGFETQRTPGDKRNERIFDSTAPLALERFAAAMESMLTPRTQKWHKLRASDEMLDEDDSVQEYLDAVTDILFSARYSPRANFASQMHESYMSLGAFGTGALLLEDAPGYGLRYRALHLAELYFCENAVGAIDMVHRDFEMSARQAMQRFGADRLPEKIRDCAEKRPEQRFRFLHCVKPNEERKHGRSDYRGMPFESYYVSFEGRAMVSEGGYRTMPYAISRYVTAPRETYGRSPAMTVLADIKMVNEMEKTILRAAHREVDPPLLLMEDGALSAFSMRPGALNFGGVDDQGRQLVHPLQTGGNIPLGLELSEQKRKVINDAFLVTLFQILVEAPTMTATEALLRAQEKGALLAPTMGRQQSEMLGPMIEREIDILSRDDAFPPMPDILRDAGAEVRIEYVSPISRAQRAEEGVGILRTLEAVAPLAQIDPSVLDVFDSEQITRILADVNGVPAKGLRSTQQVAALRQQRAQAQQAAALLQAAPVAASSAKDLAAAAQSVGLVPEAIREAA